MKGKNLAQGKLREGSAKDEGEEASVTNSILEIMPLTWFAGKPIGTGMAGQLTRELTAAYRKLVTAPIVAVPSM
ncbi:MAG: hypothetical protein E3J66_03845 [Dehalococcoidia bacterium]|nr:MAG: hypothetical protein E3J66_03845 [Dehalococcoidia bacterium]